MELLVSLISGALVAFFAGGAAKRIDMGAPINTVAGICGGGLGERIASLLGNGGPAWISGLSDAGVIVGYAAFGGIGGLAVLSGLGLVRNVLTR